MDLMEEQGELSLTDVLSVIVMNKYNVREIILYDKDFYRAWGIMRRERA